MVDRMSPPQAAMASSTAVSNSSAPFSLGCERGCITLFRADRRCQMFFFCSPKVKPASWQPDRARKSEGTISLTVVFLLAVIAPSRTRGAGRGVCARFPGVGPPVSRVDARNTVQTDISLHHYTGRAHQPTYM